MPCISTCVLGVRNEVSCECVLIAIRLNPNDPMLMSWLLNFCLILVHGRDRISAFDVHDYPKFTTIC